MTKCTEKKDNKKEVVHTYGKNLREPLTQNRYTYVSNNPLNNIDPTGHSLLSRIGNGIKNIGKKIASIANKGVTWVKNAVTNPKQAAKEIKQAAKTKAEEFKDTVQKKYENGKQEVSKFKSYASAVTSVIREQVKRELCSDKQVKIQYQGTHADFFTLGIGIGMFAGGLKMMGAGVAGTFATAGAASPATISVAGAGVAIAVVGVTTTGIALQNMFEIQVSQSNSNTEQPETNKNSNKNTKPGNNSSQKSGKTGGSSGGGTESKGDSKTGQKNNPTKGESEVWKNLDNVKGQDRKTSGTGKSKKYYEWDHTHNDIEVYNNRGNHLGSMDPTTGEMYKPAVPGRTITIN